MKRTPLFATLVLLFSLITGFAYAQEAAININTADATTLAGLTGIGQSKAEAIVAYREANGPFVVLDCSTDVVDRVIKDGGAYEDVPTEIRNGRIVLVDGGA